MLLDSPFSQDTRARHLTAMAAEPVDLLVVGGGVTGAGIARDAAMRGIRTALVDKGDFGSGTSSHSSRLVHGGLRYLETGNWRLVVEASRERRVLLSIAPHLVWPRSFLFPVHAGARVPLWKLAAGLWLYDLLAVFRNVRTHRLLSKRALLRAEPALRGHDLKGGARYFDAQCDDARLTLANIRDAHAHGALLANYVAVAQFAVADGKVRGAHVVDGLDHRRLTVRALTVVNATGPWSDETRGADGPPLLRRTKGAHVAVPRGRLGNREAITLVSPIDGRVMFLVPWGDLTYIGTTDTDSEEGPDAVQATAADVIYLLRSANAYYPEARLQPDDVVSTWAGLRPLLRPEDARSPGATSREHRIVESPSGLISIVGGKLTTYRAMAAQVVDRVAQRLRDLDGRPVARRAATHREPLPGGAARDLSVVTRDIEREGFSRTVAEHLTRLFGSEAPAVARLAQSDPALKRPVVEDHPALRAELIHAVRREMAVTLCDLLIRRTHLFYEVPGHALAEAPEVVELVGQELGWDTARQATELTAYVQEVQRAMAFRAELAAPPL
jgi:glycerol-3-phosphate dehydrogenase